MDSASKKIYDFTNEYINEYVNNPIKELIRKDPIRNLKLPSLLLLLNELREEILNSNEIINDNVIKNYINTYGKDEFLKMGQSYLKNDINYNAFDKVIDDAILKKQVMFYINRELNWVLISIFSASYISANILLRSIFELIINWIIENNNGMSDKIDSIQFLNDEEKKYLKINWKNLNKWAHPFGHWEKNVCPFYIDHKPVFYAKLFDECIKNTIAIFDLYLSIAISIYKINTDFLKNEFFYNKEVLKFIIVDRILL